MNKIIEKNKYKILFLIVSIVLSIPSIIYLAKNKTVINFNAYFTFFLKVPNSYLESMLGAIIFGAILVLLIFLYFKILKNDAKEFKNIKKIVFYVLIISVVFGIILPFTTTDIYYYMATGWMDANYNENPYYTTAKEVRLANPEDEILQKAGCWEERTVVYGPTWPLICKLLSFLSFGNITLGLYIYKLAAIAVHIVNTILVYKITGRKKFALLYGLNPLILFEMIANVHNDIYLIGFILLALYFLLKKKNILLTIVFMALAASIKYISVLLIPFLVLYYLRDKSIAKKILYCILYAVLFIIIFMLPYLIYMKDLSVFNVFNTMQSGYRESIRLILLTIQTNTGINVLKYGGFVLTAIFMLVVIDALIYMFIKKKYTVQDIMRKYNNVILVFIFGMLSAIAPWYMSWFLPTIFWLKGKNIKNILCLQFSYELATLLNFALFTEDWRIGLLYPSIMIGAVVILNIMQGYKQNRKLLKIE